MLTTNVMFVQCVNIVCAYIYIYFLRLIIGLELVGVELVISHRNEEMHCVN